MKTASVRQLRTEFPKVLGWINAGESVAITRRRRIVANLTPAAPVPAGKPACPDFAARLRGNFGTKTVSAPAMVAIVQENRGRF
jgi:antitoxin (DNA-binding transcriptional repressor) of toxin-antitoxin stability system